MLVLTNTQQVLFALLRASLKKEYEPLPSEVDWDAVLNEARQQAVPFLAAAAARELCGNAVPKQAAEVQNQALRTNMLAANAILQLNTLMRENGFAYFILKGFAAASWYPDPMQRMLGDVDFLIDPLQRSEVENVLEKAGYERWDAEEHTHHMVFRKPAQNLEMHFEIAGIPHGPQGEAVRRYMAGAVNRSEEKPLNGQLVCVPEPKYHGLVLLLHMQHHMLGEGLGLRHLMDLCVFVDRTAEEPFWGSELLPLLKEIGLYKYAQVMVKTGHLYLGTACPAWAAEAEEKLCDAVMQDILTGGNFGRKNDARAKAGMMISDHGKSGTRHGKVYHLYHTLHTSSAAYWPWIRKHPVLWFFADCGRAVKYLWRMARGKRPSLAKASAFADERRSVYERLCVFEVTQE